MSINFKRNKELILKEMQSGGVRDGISWAQIMLKYGNRMTTDEDQREWLKFIMNPTGDVDYPDIEFMDVDLEENIKIEKFQEMSIEDKDDEKSGQSNVILQNDHHLNGLTSYIRVTPLADLD